MLYFPFQQWAYLWHFFLLLLAVFLKFCRNQYLFVSPFSSFRVYWNWLKESRGTNRQRQSQTTGSRETSVIKKPWKVSKLQNRVVWKEKGCHYTFGMEKIKKKVWSETIGKYYLRVNHRFWNKDVNMIWTGTHPFQILYQWFYLSFIKIASEKGLNLKIFTGRKFAIL